MKKRPWIFQAISFLLLANLLLGQHKLVGLALFILWMIRILLLRDKSILIKTVLLTCLFILIIFTHESKNKTELKGDEEQFILSLDRSSLKIDGDYLSFTGKIKETDHQINHEKIIVQYYIQSKEEKESWLSFSPPITVLVQGELAEPAANTNFNQFNYQRYLERRKIHWQLKAQKINPINSVKIKPTFIQKIDGIRFRIIRYMDKNFHKKVSSYLKILFMAEGSAIADPIKESYRALGLIHLFSISGFHISYLARVIQRFFLRIGISHERTNIILVVILPFYGLIAGLSISIFRAVTQKTVKVWSVILNEEMDSLDAWALAMILSLMINPYSVFELSFQLSYSLSGIFILMGKRKWIRESNSLKQSLLLSVLSILISLPFLTYHFYEISWLTILSNLLFVPVFTYFLFPALSIVFLMSFLLSNSVFFIGLNKILAMILIKMEMLLLAITEHFNFSFVIGSLPYLILLTLTLSILYILKKVEQKKRPSIVLMLSIFLCVSWNRLSPVGYVLILDVGQGDSILIKEANTRKVSLIDTGGKVQWQEKNEWQERDKEFSIGKNIVLPSLKSLGIPKIDRLYISHPHADHMGEIQNISRGMEIKEIAASKETFEDEAFQEQITGMNKNKMIEIQPKTTQDYPTMNSLVLHPVEAYKDKNNQSLVLYVKMGEDYWLFTGDIEGEGEKDLIKSFPSLRIDHLKLGHHGSSTSSTNEFIDCVQPKTAFVSVGKKNSYGHPSPEVLQYLLDKEIDIYSTAEDGAIKINYFKIPFLNKWLTKIETVN